jgi:hypothetical protein
MGWCSGSNLAEDLWKEIREFIPPIKRKDVAKKIYDLFCNMDADCFDESMELIKDANINFGDD